MTGEEHAAPARPYTLQEANEACLGRGPAAADPPKLTVEDAVLLLLHANPLPLRGKGDQVRRALVAAARALRGSGVEPILFSEGRQGPSAAHIDDAVEQLAFSNKVRVFGGKGDRDIAVEITPRGRAAIREKHESLPPAARAELAQIRVGLGAQRPRPLATRNGAPPQSPSGSGTRAAKEPDRPGARRALEERPAPGEAEAARPQKYVDRGDRLLKERRYDEAYANYKLAAKLRTPDAGLHLRMALSMAEMELYKDALRHCRAAIRADPAGAAGYAAVGHYLDKIGRHAEALPYHQRAARLDPGNVQARQHASFSLFKLGRYEEALRQVEEAAELSPKDPVAHARIATCLSKMGRHEEAASAGRRAIEAAPGRADSYLSLLAALFELGRHEEALEWCRRAAKACPGDPRPHYAMVIALRALGRQEEALLHCEKSVELDPHSTDFRTAMSYLLRDLRRLPEALSHCEAVVSAEPGNLPALSNMGSMLAELGRHDEALACLGKAIQIDPEQPVPRYNLALSLQETEKPRKALGEYRRVVKLDPGNTGAYNNMGVVLSGLGRDGEALAHFDRAIELDPGNAEAHLNKALSLQHLSLHKDALAHFDRALELSPGNADAHVERLSCLVKLKLPDREIGRYAAEALGPSATARGTDLGAPARPGAPRRAPARGTAPDGDRAQLVRSLLTRDESRTLEFKSWPPSRTDRPQEPGRMNEKIARVLCSFANTDGGDLLIGVGDGGEVEGLALGGGRLSHEERDDVLARITNVIVDYFGAGHDGRFDREIVEVGGLDILHCHVDASKDGPVIPKRSLEGGHDFFVRAGSTCRPLGLKDALEHIGARWPGRASRPRPTGPSAMENQKGVMATDEDGAAIPPP